MVIRVYVSGISGLKEVKKRQQRVMMILESKHIPYETLDITESGRDADKEFLQKAVGPTPDEKFPLTPQIFNEDTYCGNYDQFDESNEIDDLETFLGIPKQTPKERLQNGMEGAPRKNLENGEEEEEVLEESKPAEEEAAAEEDHPAATEESHSAATEEGHPAATEDHPAATEEEHTAAEPEHSAEEPVTNDAPPEEEKSVEPPPPAEEREEAEGASEDAVDQSRGEAEGSEEGATQD